MDEILEFLKKCGTFFLATSVEGKPRVRPFGAVMKYEDKLYVVTANTKFVYKEMVSNPNVSLCAAAGDTWVRVTGIAKEDKRAEARQAMLDACPMLKSMYKADDGIMTVFCISQGEGTIFTLNKVKETYKI